MDVTPRHRSSIDPGLVPAALWTRAYLRRSATTPGSSDLTIALRRADGTASLFCTQVLASGIDDAATYLHVERTVKFLLWSRGGEEILLSGPAAESLALKLRTDYAPKGVRSFDSDFSPSATSPQPSFPSPPPRISPSADTSTVVASASTSEARTGSARR
jgi:hypothetical protein